MDPAVQQAQQLQTKDQIANAPPQVVLQNPDNDLKRREGQKNAVQSESRGGRTVNRAADYNFVNFGEDVPWAEIGGKWGSAGCTSAVTVGELKPLWLQSPGQPERLVLARLAVANGRRIAQGVILDWPRLRDVLLTEIHDLFPEAQLLPVEEGAEPEAPERQMTALPVQLDPGPRTAGVLWVWSPVRVGLLLAWAAALLALAVVGLGGWSLLDLSERRFRFVSAVTHELRTPLTTLRLYLDMLNSGFVREEPQKA
jgi:signal transduction histidine kinase